MFDEKFFSFLEESNRLKMVDRVITLENGRKESDTDHSWHVAFVALMLLNLDNYKHLDKEKVLKLALIHDLCEIYAGDTYFLDNQTNKKENEKNAWEKLIKNSPDFFAGELKLLSEEYENRATKESIFVSDIDKILGFFVPLLNGGIDFQTYKLEEEILRKNKEEKISSDKLMKDIFYYYFKKAKDEDLFYKG